MPRSSERSVQAPATRSGVPGLPERVPVAIALSYERGKDPAPRVVASGRGAVAEQILEIAFAAGIKVREDADLAEVLSTVELDSVIPLEAFAAVAEIVAYLYRANARLAGDDVAAAFPTGKPATMLVR